MKAKLTVEMDNMAFEQAPGRELSRILREAAARVLHDGTTMAGDPLLLRDINGNTVGTLEITEDWNGAKNENFHTG